MCVISIFDYAQFFGIMILFFVVLYAAYFVSKNLGKWQKNQASSANMNIMEVLSVGPQKTLQLVRIGNKYLLISVTKERINNICEINEKDLIIQDTKDLKIPFETLIEKLKNKRNKNESIGKEQTNKILRKEQNDNSEK